MTDALKIARFCWPAREWVADDEKFVRSLPCSGQDMGFTLDETDGAYCEMLSLPLWRMRDAELVLIERGLADGYAWYLLDELDLYTPKEINKDCVLDVAWKCATAPLDARVRAMVAVIDQQARAGEAEGGK